MVIAPRALMRREGRIYATGALKSPHKPASLWYSENDFPTLS